MATRELMHAALLDEQKTRQRAELYRVLSDETRLQILALLLSRGGTLSVIEITEHFCKAQPTISNHIGQLRRAGLIDYTSEDKFNYYFIKVGREAEVRGYLGGL